MNLLRYEFKRYLLGGIITLAFITVLMILSIFYETSIEYKIDQIVLIVALLGFLVSSIVVYVKQYRMQQVLYYHADNQGFMKTHSFAFTMIFFITTLLIYGIIFINIKALFEYLDDYYIFLENGIDQYVFVFIGKHIYEILMMLFVYIFNIAFLVLVVSYGIFLILHKIKYERIHTNKRTFIINIIGLVLIHTFYRLFIFILYRPLDFLDFNHFRYYDLISYGNKLIFINPLFLPASIIFGFEIYRMQINIKYMVIKSNEFTE
jgi:hypothetical protein